MKTKPTKLIGLITVLVVSGYIGAAIDYTYRENISKKSTRSNATERLAYDLFLVDAINSNHEEQANEVLIGSVKANMLVLAKTKVDAREATEHTFPCALVKKSRQLYQDGHLKLANDDKADAIILSYMRDNCPGLPNQSNMADMPGWENSDQRNSKPGSEHNSR